MDHGRNTLGRQGTCGGIAKHLILLVRAYVRGYTRSRKHIDHGSGTYVRMYIRMYVCMHACKYIRMHVHIMRIYIYIYINYSDAKDECWPRLIAGLSIEA